MHSGPMLCCALWRYLVRASQDERPHTTGRAALAVSPRERGEQDSCLGDLLAGFGLDALAG